MIKHQVKSVFYALCWNDKAINKRKLEIMKEFMLNEINEDPFKTVSNNLQCAQFQ